MADRKVFDIKFDFSMLKSPRRQVLSRFGWIGERFHKGHFCKKFSLSDVSFVYSLNILKMVFKWI